MIHFAFVVLFSGIVIIGIATITNALRQNSDIIIHALAGQSRTASHIAAQEFQHFTAPSRRNSGTGQYHVKTMRQTPAKSHPNIRLIAERQLRAAA